MTFSGIKVIDTLLGVVNVIGKGGFHVIDCGIGNRLLHFVCRGVHIQIVFLIGLLKHGQGRRIAPELGEYACLGGQGDILSQ